MKFFYVFLFSLLPYGSAESEIEKECLQKLDSAEGIGDACSKQLRILCTRHDILFTLWDASSRIVRDGLTAASSSDLGYYDLCVNVDTRIGETDILGKYCPYEWSSIIPKKTLEEVVADMEISSNKNTKFSLFGEERKKNNSLETEYIALVGGLCITDGCTPTEFSKVFSTYVYPVKQADKGRCMTKHTRRDLNTFQLVTTICLALVLATMVFCTIVHVVYHYRKTGKSHDFIEGFSALNNGRKIVSISNDTENQIQCMNGLRFISILWIIAGHGFSTSQTIPHINAQYGNEWRKTFYSQYIQAAVFAVDTFFFLSGFLLTYGYLSKTKNRSIIQQITGIPLIYLNRYLRLTPAVGAMFLTSISFYKLIGDGPLWFISYDMIEKPCTQYWWRFFLYIQNYYPNDLCFTQTWYLSADMQMFFFAPLVLIPCSKYYQKKILFVMAGLIILMGTFMGISLAIPYVIDGYKNDYDTHTRVSDYLVGVIGGVIFVKNKGKQIRINKFVNLMLWATTFGMMIFLAYCRHYVQVNDSKLIPILFSAFCKPMWCVCILWIVFSCYHGYGGFINWFLSNPLFQVGARLSYCMYVLHGLVIFYTVGRIRTYLYFGNYEMISLSWGYINNCILISILWTLTFEGPMIMLNKKILGRIGAPKRKDEPKKDLA